MIVYLANKTQFRAGILFNRIEFSIPRADKRGDLIVICGAHRVAAPLPALSHE